VVGDPVDRLPHLVTFSCLYVDGEAIVTELDKRGYGVASGSACTASTLTPSHVLEAMGVLTHGNVRVSLTRDTTSEDVGAFLAAMGVLTHGNVRVSLHSGVSTEDVRRFLAVLPGLVAGVRAEVGM